MNDEQFNRIEALLLLNAYCMMSSASNRDGPEVWEKVAGNCRMLQKWLDDGHTILTDYPSSTPECLVHD